MNLTACGSLPTRPVTGTWYRALQFQYMGAPLSASHTPAVASRFSEGSNSLPPYELMYFAETHQVALFEVGAMVGSPIDPYGPLPHPRHSQGIINVDVVLHSVVDLTEEAAQTTIDMTAQELTGDWRYYSVRSIRASVHGPNGAAPTQALGAALFGLPGLEGFITISAKCPDQRVLAVFTEKLHPASRLTFTHPGGLTYSIP